MARIKNYYYPLSIIGLLFFVFGFLTWVNGILIPYFQICLELTNFQALQVTFAAYVAYFFLAIPSAWVLKLTGYKKGIVLGLSIMAFGTLCFIPAAYTRTYEVFLSGLFITGAGLTILQTAANPYVAIIGPAEGTAQRIGFMGISNKVAGILSQRILGAIFFLNADNIVAEAAKLTGTEKAKLLDAYVLKIVPPYLAISAFLILLAIIIFFSGLPEVKEHGREALKEKTSSDKKSIFQFPYLIWGVITLFFSSACEVIPIDGIILYSRSLGISLENSRHFSEYTLYAMLIGYLASTILIPKYLSQQLALKLCAITGLILTTGAYFTEGITSIFFMIGMGIGASMLWGTIWGIAIRDLGNYTKLGSALLLMTVVGCGIFPLLFGSLIDNFSHHPQTAVLMLIPCNLVMLYYSSYGYKLNTWKKAQVKGNSKILVNS